MNKSFSNILLLTVLLLTVLTAGCSDDISDDRKGHGEESVLLMIPTPHLEGTRAEDAALNETMNEGHISSLWFYAFPADGTAADNRVAVDLTPSDSKLTHDYRQEEVRVKAGKYRVYMVANIEGLNGDSSEDAIKTASIEYSTSKMPNTTDGLPMACLPEEVKVGETTPEVVADGIVTVENGKQTTLWIDLTFLCAKVRYTLLFDKSASGFSHEAFGSQALTFTGLEKVSGVRSVTSVTDANTPDSGEPFEIDDCSEFNGASRVYPTDYSKFIELNSANDPSENDLAELSGQANPDKRAYQGTLYLPENLVTSAPTRLFFGANLDGGSQKLQYHVDLPPLSKGNSDREPMRRGHFYDIIGRVTTTGDRLDITASVADWTLQSLAYQLHGTYFLHVDKTDIKVQAGVATLIKYDTDAEPLTFESEKYNGTDLFHFEKVEKEGQKYVSVTVNPEIAAETGVSFNSYFFICAANLKKKIEVNPVTLEPFLNVDPTNIEINVREYIASGEYSATIPITFNTNLSNVSITGFIDDLSIDSHSIDLDGSRQYTGTAVGTNNLQINNMNGGSFWATSRTLTLLYTATDNSNNHLSETVTIRIIPNQQNYVIHLRPNDDWHVYGRPHIYVYQSLKLPSNHETYPSKTVGYYKNDDVYAALEYSFTGKIAFKGWVTDKSKTNDSNYAFASGEIKSDSKGFFMFSNDTDSWCYEAWNASVHYDLNYDFCKTYRETTGGKLCSECNGEHYCRVWPGIVMEYEGEGWWKFELTGVATPGSALIMFASKHGDTDKRYPDKDQNGKSMPGIPLFDFPNRNGWLDLRNGARQFTNAKPGIPSGQAVYRIYWPTNRNKQYCGLNMWVTNGTILTNSHDPNHFWEDPNYPNYRYWEFVISKSALINVQGRTGENGYQNEKTNMPLTDFKLDNETGIYYYTLYGEGNGNGKGGKPW